ncbi:MAG TPA: CHAT domain-containing protein [Streptosporangiaceae bacterium]|nr:CHAT domain-containing protein [Streptosporangiaceae bacterium]
MGDDFGAVFEVAIGPASTPGWFQVNVIGSAAGSASATVSLDVDALHVRREELQTAILASATSTRQILARAERPVREVGEALFTALLGTAPIAEQYRACGALAAQSEQTLRVVLRIGTPELAELPWEAMYDPVFGYVCRHEQLVRQIPVASVPAPMTVRLPLHILAIISSPSDFDTIDVDRERDRLTEALAEPIRAGLVEIGWVRDATWPGAHLELVRGRWHVVHFTGHGGFDASQDLGVLALMRPDGRALRIHADQFTDLLRQAKPMPRLVVLNSCAGAAGSTTDLFSGTAGALVRAGVPAVAAMQYEITDAASAAFVQGFYTALAYGRGIDEAMSSGRVAILGTSNRTLEWLTPVLYLRGHQTRLFNPPAKAGSPARLTGLRATIESSALYRPSHVLKHQAQVNCVAFGMNGTLLATAGEDHTAQLWDTETGTSARALSGHEGRVNGVAFSPDGTVLATTSDDQTIGLWDTPTGTLIRTLSCGAYSFPRGVAFSPDGRTLATASSYKTALLWDTASGALRRRLTGHTDLVRGIAFSPDGAVLATASDDRTACLWDGITGALIRFFTGHTDWVGGVAFSPDGAMLATASRDHTVRLWDTNSGTLIRTLTGHADIVWAVAVSPDGTLVASASRDKTVRLWNARSGEFVDALAGHTEAVWGVAFSPDGAILGTGGWDKTARLWKR